MRESIFDEWDDIKSVSCNDCDEYWKDQCDGVSEGSERVCKAFKASRRVVIPLKIKWLQRAVKWLTACVLILMLMWMLMLVWLIRESQPEPKQEAVVPKVTEVEQLSVVKEEPVEVDPLASYTKLENVKVTHYCICEKCCGKSPDHPAYGITRSGVKAIPGVSVAVDPILIPLGSEVIVDYGDGVLHTMSADDTGSGVNGSHIDICVSGHQEALELGVKKATVYYKSQG